MPLILPSGNAETPAVPGHVQEALQNEPNATDKREVKSTDPSPVPSAPSISQNGESGGTTLSSLSKPLPVAVSSGNTDNPLVRNRVQEPAKSLARPLDPGTAPEDTLHRKSTASATAKSILRGVEESSLAYPLLKSVAKHLRLILDNCEVHPPSRGFNSQRSQLR